MGFYDSEFIRYKKNKESIFELLQIGMENNDNVIDIKLNHYSDIPLREQILLNINKEGYKDKGISFEDANKKIENFILENNISNLVLFCHKEDLELYNNYSTKYSITKNKVFDNFIDVSYLIRNFYSLDREISLTNFCSLFDINFSDSGKFHDAVNDAIFLKKLLIKFLENVSNSKYNKDYINGFVFCKSKINTYTINSLKMKDKVFYSLYKNKYSYSANKNGIFSYLDKVSMKKILVSSLPLNSSTDFKIGFNTALEKFLNNE